MSAAFGCSGAVDTRPTVCTVGYLYYIDSVASHSFGVELSPLHSDLFDAAFIDFFYAEDVAVKWYGLAFV